MGLRDKLAELGVNKQTAPAATILIPVKSLLFMFAVTFMVDKLGPIQIQLFGLSMYALYTEGTGWIFGIIGNSIAKDLFGMSKFVDKFLFKTISDISYILMQVAGAAIFFIVLQLVFM